MRKETKIEYLTVDFYEVIAGWLRYKLTIGEQSFSDSFSHVFDPLLDLKHWLEAISIGVQQTSFLYDNEGTFIKFDFKQGVFTISEAYGDEEVFINARVDRQQIVKAFYLGLLTFANSDKFQSKEWEIEFMKERLCKTLNIDEDTLIKQLADLDKKELRELLFNANPTYYISLAGATMFLQNIDKDKISDQLKRIEKPIEWNIPDEYNFWKTDKKRQFVIDCINEITSDYNGLKINDFRSSIIETYIEFLK